MALLIQNATLVDGTGGAAISDGAGVDGTLRLPLDELAAV